MDASERLAEELAARGLRVTQQRLQVLQALRQLDHPTAGELYDKLSEDIPNLSKKTVYSTLETLEEAELAVRLSVGDGAHRYEANTEPHSHAHCRACGRLEDLPHASTPAALPAGFTPERVFVMVQGTCRDCR